MMSFDAVAFLWSHMVIWLASITCERGIHAMSPTLKALGIDQLSVAQRLLLVEEIWDSIADEEADVPLTDAQRLDLQRRVAAYEANPKAGSTWEEVKARLREKP
jgi:putative addiction module component (TIGR02574 family)